MSEVTLADIKAVIAKLKDPGPPPRGTVIFQNEQSAAVADGEGGIIALVPMETIVGMLGPGVSL